MAPPLPPAPRKETGVEEPGIVPGLWVLEAMGGSRTHVSPIFP